MSLSYHILSASWDDERQTCSRENNLFDGNSCVPGLSSQGIVWYCMFKKYTHVCQVCTSTASVWLMMSKFGSSNSDAAKGYGNKGNYGSDLSTTQASDVFWMSSSPKPSVHQCFPRTCVTCLGMVSQILDHFLMSDFGMMTPNDQLIFERLNLP